MIKWMLKKGDGTVHDIDTPVILNVFPTFLFAYLIVLDVLEYDNRRKILSDKGYYEYYWHWINDLEEY